MAQRFRTSVSKRCTDVLPELKGLGRSFHNCPIDEALQDIAAHQKA